ncbi:hypothetical protein ABZ635_00045 [Nocardiopsis sp. NPDC007018]|uniref:hypothetical protein n=1 Tax=Nocardiopsis sp. NPDC007018 TaxID=3155721 RepID=UPI0033F56884
MNGLGEYGLGVADRLHDHVALDEIELYAEVLIAVADTEHPLSPAEIDRALGLPCRTVAGGPPPDDSPATSHDGDPSASEPEPTTPGEAARPDAPNAAPASPVPAPAGPERVRRQPVPEGVPGTGRPGAVPPARDGHRPPVFVLPVRGGTPDPPSGPRPLCDVVLPHFVPWRAWHL